MAARFLDKAQKKESLHRVTVVLILADRLDPMLSASLYELVCSQCGDEFKNCLVPCVVDLEHRGCVFNCLRFPYVGYSYPVKNRGIRIVKRVVFGGNLNLKGSPHFLEPPRGIDREDSLWAFWKKLHGQLVGSKRANKKRFEAMAEQEILVDENTLYLKLDGRGICQAVSLDTEKKSAKVEAITNWAYPTRQLISRKNLQKAETCITSYYARAGYETEFVKR